MELNALLSAFMDSIKKHLKFSPRKCMTTHGLCHHLVSFVFRLFFSLQQIELLTQTYRVSCLLRSSLYRVRAEKISTCLSEI